jgi:NitT/TauT family transport system substrate-binding protein
MTGRDRGTGLTRRALAPALVGLAGLTLARPARAQETIRIGLPTKAFWPTIVTDAAVRRKLFDREGIGVEPTIYRGGAECFEALAAGAADLVLDAPALTAAGLLKGVNSKVVSCGSTTYAGWQLLVRKDSPITDVAGLAGKKVGITSTGSGSDLLAQWTMQDHKLEFTRVPLGGGGLIPNLRTRNVDAAVVYSPLSFQQTASGAARVLIDYATAVPPHVNAGWIASDAVIRNKPDLVQKSLNALFGGVAALRADRAAAIALIAEVDEIPPEIATMEYEQTTLHLSADGVIDPAMLVFGLQLARLGGITDMAPADQVYTTQFKPVPTA